MKTNPDHMARRQKLTRQKQSELATIRVRKAGHYKIFCTNRKNYLYLRFLAASDFFLRFTLGFS